MVVVLVHFGKGHHGPICGIRDCHPGRWISWSHFEVDECGALNNWLEVAPSAQGACSVVGALVNMNDFADRPPLGMEKGQVLTTGQYRFRFQPTPHLPHGWDAGMLFEETQKILFCSDLFHQVGDVEPVIESDLVLERYEVAGDAFLVGYDHSPERPVEVLYFAGASYLAGELPAEALSVLDNVLTKESTPRLWSLLGDIHYLRKDYEEASEAFRTLLDMGEDSGRAWLMMGYCALEMGKKDEALDHLAKASTFEDQSDMAQLLMQRAMRM